VIFANDHNVENRLFLKACNQLKIKTVYLQHATTSELFPPLDFDLSFLYGAIDQKKYGNIGRGKIFLMGSPKLDKIFSVRRNETYERTKTLGIAINTIDESKKIIALIEKIIRQTEYKVELRMHADDARDLNVTSGRVFNHNAKNKSLENYFSGIDFQISGESSIHLESLYLNIPSVYHNFAYQESRDYFHFLKEGLLTVLDTKKISQTYFDYLATNLIPKKIFQKFIHSVGKPYDGSVGPLIIEKIRHNDQK
jgi:hypothetical protein